MMYNKWTSIEPKDPERYGQCEECGADIYEGQCYLVNDQDEMFCDDECLYNFYKIKEIS